MYRAAFAILTLSALTGPARAEIWTAPTGDAVDHVTHLCDPCCKLTNYHPNRSVEAKLFTPMRPIVLRLGPLESGAFGTGRNCVKAGIGLEVRFAP